MNPSWLYTVKSGDGDQSCRLGVDDGQAAILWKDTVYVLEYPCLQSGDRVMYPCLVRYGIERNNGYIDAPLLSQNTDMVWSFGSLDAISSIAFDASCESVLLDIFLYEQGAQEPSERFDSFDEITFDESRIWTIVVNAEVTMDAYRVQCGYELIYSPN